MSFWEYLGNRHQQLLTDAYQHVSAVFQCMVIATVLGVLIGVVTYRSGWAGSLAITSTATILTIPSSPRSVCSSRWSGSGSRPR